MDDGASVDADVVVVATGVRPSPFPGDSGLTTAGDGSMQVGDTLQCVDYPEILGGGDCISLEERPLDRVGVYAVRQGPILFHNLAAHLCGEPLKTFIPQKHYLLVLNLGDGTGLAMWRGIVFHGRWAFRFKDWLDRRFIRRFQ
jgi:NADH dehydrogenase FAD-containing subunit